MFDNSSNRNVSFCVQSQPLAQPEIDPAPSPYFPTSRTQTLLSQAKLEKENHLNRQTNLVDRIDYLGNAEAPLVQNRTSTEQVITPLKLNQQSRKVARQGQDSLTGLKQSQTIVASATASKLLGSSFDTTFGYGLVNAAKAVAWAAGYYPHAFADVANWGGVHWGNDYVKAQEAWAWGKTGRGVTVAVIDSGVDIYHPDLNDNIWRNPGEIAGDRIDNDRNGYVDDLFGWNFGAGQNNNNVLPGTRDPGQAHGTHVAGTIAAEYNGFGTTGVAPNAKIMALRISDVRGNRFTNPGNLAEAIRYAVNNGAKVINMSLGWTESPELINALNYAASRNVITVSAAGNSGLASPFAPAKYATHLGISVGAIDSRGRIANFSNRAGYDSRMQHVVAPGVGVWSTMPTNFSKWYDTMNGTSMAAPHVAGVVALMLSANPNLTHAQVRYILTQSATGPSYSSSFSSSARSSHSSGSRSTNSIRNLHRNHEGEAIDVLIGKLV